MQEMDQPRRAGLGMTVALLFLAGCNAQPLPVYEGKQGFKFTPPPGWVERDRENALPTSGRKPVDLPLPALDEAGKERLLVRYDRVTAGRLAWLRITTAGLPADASLKEQVGQRSPGAEWKCESEPEELQVSKLPATRIAFTGRWDEQDYLSETAAVRHGEQVYFITASFPAADGKAREQVRKAVAAATWK